jgi:hypothetical protein
MTDIAWEEEFEVSLTEARRGGIKRKETGSA